MTDWTVRDLDEARTYWATLARRNPLNASSLVYGLINDLEDAGARLAEVEAEREAAYERIAAVEALTSQPRRELNPVSSLGYYWRGYEYALHEVRAAMVPATEVGVPHCTHYDSNGHNEICCVCRRLLAESDWSYCRGPAGSGRPASGATPAEREAAEICEHVECRQSARVEAREATHGHLHDCCGHHQCEVAAGDGAGAAQTTTHPYAGPTYDGNGWIDSCGAKVDGRYCFKLPEHPIHQTTTHAFVSGRRPEHTDPLDCCARCGLPAGRPDPRRCRVSGQRYEGPTEVMCPEKCEIPAGYVMVEVPRPRHNWGDVFACPNDCPVTLMVLERPEQP